MNFEIENAYSKLTGDISFEEMAQLKRACTIVDICYRRRKGEVHPTQYEKKKCFLKGGKVPTGLLPRIRANGVSFTTTDKRVRPKLNQFEVSLKFPKKITKDSDWSFQLIPVRDALLYGRGLLHYPTGAGKTFVISQIIYALKVKTVVIVPNLELLWQTYRKFCDYFGPANVCKVGGGSGVEGMLYTPITVATQQTLYSTMKKDKELFDRAMKNVDALFLDECHHVAEGGKKKKSKDKSKEKELIGNTWWNVALNIPAYYRFGVSATLKLPDRLNNQFVLESVTGRIISSITVSELISKYKVLCPIKVTMVNVPADICKSWKNVYRKERVCFDCNKTGYARKDKKCKYCKSKNVGPVETVLVEAGALEVNILAEYRHELICRIVKRLWKSKRKKVLILVDLVDMHGKLLHEMLTDTLKVPSVLLVGYNSRDERDEGIEEFVKKRRPLISTIVKEGFDIPAIDALVIAGGGKSIGALIQKIGRVRRASPGKTFSELWDIFDDDGESSQGPRMCARHSVGRMEVYLSVPEDTFRMITVEDFENE